MAISEKALREFQDALGENNVSADPGVLHTYSYMNSMFSVCFSYWNPRPVAVALPSTTDEVVKIMEICGRHNLTFKPLSGGWVWLALAFGENAVLIDLRRMDRMPEINETDGYAVCESYVPGGIMQAEVMKKGYNCHMSGGGPNLMQLATATSCQGSGGEAQSMSFQERNLLGVELVTANGDILHCGSPGTPGAGWFCGDGPGPNLRGMLRGAMGNIGAHGVYTRIGLKLYPWYAEPYDCHGSPPFYESERPENYNIRVVWWETPEAEAEALYQLSEAELTDYCARVGSGTYESNAAISNKEFTEIVESGTYRKKFPRGPWTFSIAAASPRALEYRTTTLDEIIEEIGGHSIDPFSGAMGHTDFELTIQQAIRAMYVMKGTFMPTGAFACNPPFNYETIDQIWKYAEPIVVDLREEWMGRDAIMKQPIDNIYCSLDEHGHFGHIETIFQCDYDEPKNEALGIEIKGIAEGWKNKINGTYMSLPAGGEVTMHWIHYMKRIMKMLDETDKNDSWLRLVGGLMNTIEDVKYLEEDTAGSKDSRKGAHTVR